MSNNKSLQTKLIIALILPSILVFALMLGLFSYWRADELKKEFVQQHEESVELYATMIAEPVWQFDRQTLKAMAENTVKKSDAIWIEILDEEGEVLANFKNTELFEHFDTNTYHKKPIVYIGRNNELVKVGELHMAFSNRWLQNYVMVNLRWALALAVAIIFVQFIGLLVIFKKLIRQPIDALVFAIRESERTSQLVKVDLRTNDEFGLVIDAYNQMQLQITSHGKRLERVYNKTPALLCYVNTLGQITIVSDFFCDKLAIPRSRIIGFSLSNFLIDNNPQSGSSKSINSALVSGVPLNNMQAILNTRSSEMKTHVLISSLPERANNSELLGSFCVMTDITSQVEAQAALEYQANYDLLTGLPNRYHTFERLKEDIATSSDNEKYLALVFIDLDRFKWVNDSYGHNVGDQLLIKVADRLRVIIRKVDTAGRFGGDEFVIVIPFVSHKQQIIDLMGPIIHELSKPYEVVGKKISSTVSAGIAIYPVDGETPEMLLMHADTAMYQVKISGRNNFMLFNPEQDSFAKQRINCAEELVSAIEEQRVELFFQPIVSLFDKTVHGYEALMRIKGRADQQIIPPSDFITLAEELGVINALGLWSIEAALHAFANWPKNNAKRPKPEYISVNVSPIQFRDLKLPQKINELLIKYQVPPIALVLEITESCIIELSHENKQTLQALRDVGCTLSIDDFGTGYSSLSNLKNFPYLTLKIDREFLKDILSDDETSMNIMRAILSMANTLGLKVVIEGIENESIFNQIQRFLISKENTFGQGYYFGEPEPLSLVQSFYTKS